MFLSLVDISLTMTLQPSDHSQVFDPHPLMLPYLRRCLTCEWPYSLITFSRPLSIQPSPTISAVSFAGCSASYHSSIAGLTLTSRCSHWHIASNVSACSRSATFSRPAFGPLADRLILALSICCSHLSNRLAASSSGFPAPGWPQPALGIGYPA